MRKGGRANEIDMRKGGRANEIDRVEGIEVVEMKEL